MPDAPFASSGGNACSSGRVKGLRAGSGNCKMAFGKGNDFFFRRPECSVKFRMNNM